VTPFNQLLHIMSLHAVLVNQGLERSYLLLLGFCRSGRLALLHLVPQLCQQLAQRFLVFLNVSMTAFSALCGSHQISVNCHKQQRPQSVHIVLQGVLVRHSHSNIQCVLHWQRLVWASLQHLRLVQLKRRSLPPHI